MKRPLTAPTEVLWGPCFILKNSLVHSSVIFEAAAGGGRQVSPRLDDGCGLGGWRNGLLFDPFKKYGEWSYMDIMVDPLIRALRTAMNPDTKVVTLAPSLLEPPASMCREGEG